MTHSNAAEIATFSRHFALKLRRAEGFTREIEGRLHRGCHGSRQTRIENRTNCRKKYGTRTRILCLTAVVDFAKPVLYDSPCKAGTP